jgi:hypothetical protein
LLSTCWDRFDIVFKAKKDKLDYVVNTFQDKFWDAFQEIFDKFGTAFVLIFYNFNWSIDDSFGVPYDLKVLKKKGQFNCVFWFTIYQFGFETHFKVF